MQELIVNGLLTVVVVTAIVLRFFIGNRADSGMTKKQKKMLVRILIAAAMLLGLQYLEVNRWVRLALYMVDYLVIGYDILRKAFKGILNKQVFDENFLMAVATVGAMALAIYENGDYLEAIAVMLASRW